MSHGVVGEAAHLSQATCHGSMSFPPFLLIPRCSVCLSVCLSVSVQGLWSGGGMGNLTLAALLRSFLVGDTGEG